MEISNIDTLYSYDDGDVITPGMGLSIMAGHVLAQYWNPTTKRVSADSDFTVAANQPTVYPQAFSSKAGAYVVPEATGEQWYLNNLGADTAGILDSGGAVKSAYTGLFVKTSYTVNGKTYPALKIKGNLCSVTDLTGKTLYYQSTYDGKQIVCKIDIAVNVSVGTPYEVVISCVNEEGVNDTVIDGDTEYLVLTAYLSAANEEVSATSYKWQKLEGGEWTDLSSSGGVYTVSGDGKTLRVYDAGLDGIETFRAVLVYNGQTYSRTTVLSDTHDPYYIDMGKSLAGQSVLRSESVSYTPKVYSRPEGTLESGWTFGYSLTDNDGTLLTKEDGMTTFSVSGATVYEYGTVNVSIRATKG